MGCPQWGRDHPSPWRLVAPVEGSCKGRGFFIFIILVMQTVVAEATLVRPLF